MILRSINRILIVTGITIALGGLACHAPMAAPIVESKNLVKTDLSQSNQAAHPKPSLIAVILNRLTPNSDNRPRTEQRLIVLQAGDSLQSVLANARIQSQDINGAISSLNREYNLRSLPAGIPISIETRAINGKPHSPPIEYRLLGISFNPDVRSEINVARQPEVASSASPDPQVKFITTTRPRSLSHRINRVDLTITNSLYESADKAGVPGNVMGQAIRLLSWDVDFQRDIQSGDQLSIIYDDYRTIPNPALNSGLGSANLATSEAKAIGGEVYGLELKLGNRWIKIYRFEGKDGKITYLDDKGQGLAKSLMRTPVNGARLTSKFGMRKNPVLGYTAMHKGIDFGAAIGTPIFAAGDGVITSRKYSNSYGNAIEIRHRNNYSTLYAHMNGFAANSHVGSRVTQGQVIGYIGKTGQATGPHLHYEVKLNGRSINPMTLQMQRASKIAGAELHRFQAIRDSIASISESRDFASVESNLSPVRLVAAKK
ncbi:MAG: peptidoglycan DD-metalloendopeptidase family protein [Candidatus Pacebacteria bacterium]|nr:peptidoglycan DD-metalloendopeptidase family protein [Candidatus Paceibacterota bacterium]